MENTAKSEIWAMPETAQASSQLVMKNGNKTFIIVLRFSESCKVTLEDKVKELIKKDVENGNF